LKFDSCAHADQDEKCAKEKVTTYQR